MTAIPLAVMGFLVGALLSLLYVLPPDHAPVRDAPQWAGTVAPGNDPDPQVDPSYQRQTQRRCMRWYQQAAKRAMKERERR